MAHTSRKPWPADAVMIIAAVAGQERRENMQTVVEVACRDCHRDLAACSYTIAQAEAMPERRGRPVKFFCPACAVGYDVQSITHMRDHAGVTIDPDGRTVSDAGDADPIVPGEPAVAYIRGQPTTVAVDRVEDGRVLLKSTCGRYRADLPEQRYRQLRAAARAEVAAMYQDTGGGAEDGEGG